MEYINYFNIDYEYAMRNKVLDLGNSKAIFHCNETDYYYYFNGTTLIRVLGDNLEEVLEIVRREALI